MSELFAKVILEHRRKDKIENYLDLYSERIARPLDGLSLKKDGDRECRFVATFTIPLMAKSPELLIYEILELAQEIEHKAWLVRGPFKGESLIFECSLDNEDDDQMIKWAYFELKE